MSTEQADHATNAPAPQGWESTTQEKCVSTSFGLVNVRIGGNESGKVIVFWPSLLLDASMWAYQFQHYAPDYRVVLVNPPGIGKSDPLRRPITVDQSAACLEQIVDGLGIGTFILVGNSWGSLIAVAYAARHPDRLTAAVITNGTAAPPTPEVTSQMTELVSNLERFTTAPDWLLPATQQAFSGPTAEADKPEFLSYLGRVLQEDPVSIAFAMKGILLGREDLHPTARLIKDVPFLVLAGEEDRFFSLAEGNSLAGAITGSHFVVLPKTGHLSPRESPELVNAEIDEFFVKSLRQI